MASDPVAEAVYRSRLAVTANGKLTHIAQPSRFRLTMCGARRAVDYALDPGAQVLLYHYPPVPQGQRVCSRCQAAYDREMAHA